MKHYYTNEKTEVKGKDNLLKITSLQSGSQDSYPSVTEYEYMIYCFCLQILNQIIYPGTLTGVTVLIFTVCIPLSSKDQMHMCLVYKCQVQRSDG